MPEESRVGADRGAQPTSSRLTAKMRVAAGWRSLFMSHLGSLNDPPGRLTEGQPT